MGRSAGVYPGLAESNFRISQMEKREKHNFMTVPLYSLSWGVEMAHVLQNICQSFKPLRCQPVCRPGRGCNKGPFIYYRQRL
jgi:hypothetical protein